MPKRGAIALGLTALALVLLISFQPPADVAVATRSGAAGADGVTGGSRADTTETAGARTIAGPVIETRWGPVQVSVTLDGSEITDVAAIQLPDGDRRSAQISSRTEPVLREQALEGQSADIDGVSGATYTSDAYARSLQAALDSAGT